MATNGAGILEEVPDQVPAKVHPLAAEYDVPVIAELRRSSTHNCWLTLERDETYSVKEKQLARI